MHPRDRQFDTEQDAELRAVPVPEGLVDRLRRVALADDDGLDAAVRELSVPPGLVARLQRSILADDEALDAAIRDVRVPVDLLGRLRRLPKGRLRLARLTQWAAAASLVFGIGLSYVGAMVALLLLSAPAHDVSRPRLAATWEVALAEVSDHAVIVVGDRGGTIIQPAPPWPRRRPEPAFPPMAVKLVEYEHSVSERFIEAVTLPGSVDPFLEASPWGVLGSYPTSDPNVADLPKVPGPVPRGIQWPLVPGANLGFLIHFGVHPFVSPAADSQLRTSVVPLDVGPSSYELTRRYLNDRELPPPAVVRTEEFLAAADFEFPPPAGSPLGLSIGGGPSPFALYNFGDEHVRMLQIGIQAQRIRHQQHRPAHLVLVVDVSASMRLGGRLDMVRRALAQLVDRLGPEDRVSLLAFSEKAELIVEDCGPQDARDLAAAIRSLAAGSSTNLAAGLQKAYAVAPSGIDEKEKAVRIVLLTDGQAELRRGTTDLIEQQLTLAAAHKVFLDVVDVGQGEEIDRQLASFAKAGGGKIRRATNADQVRWALLESSTGTSQLVASDALLKVTFDLKTVLEYRLLGHEARELAGLNPADPKADFYAGQAATALYEIRFRKADSGNASDVVATVELTWNAPGGGPTRTLIQKVRRRDFTSTFLQSALSLQHAALVAQAAEVIRRSPFGRVPPGRTRPNARSLALVLSLARQVDTSSYERSSFAEFLSLLNRAEGKEAGP